MKSKIVGILVCTMLITTFLTVATNDDNIDFKNISHTMLITSSFDDDTPTWYQGDKWTYKIDDFDIDIKDNQSTQEIHVHLEIDRLQMEVINDAVDYDLQLSAKVKGDFSINIDQGGGSTFNVSGRLWGTNIEGNIIFTKSNLDIKEIDGKLSGLLTVKLNKLPDDFPIPLIPIPIPILATIEANIDFSSPFTLIDFPLNTNKTWGLSATNFTVNGEIRSPWLYIIDIINKIATILGNPLISPENANLLPIIDIKEALEMRNMSNIFEIPEVPMIFTCFNRENITVPTIPPKTFNAYNISVALGVGNIYYVPEIKNIIKISGYFGDIFPFLPFTPDIEMELIDYELV